MAVDLPDRVALESVDVGTTQPQTSPEERVAELQEAIAARDAFIAVVAHELRNPMTPILGSVQRLRRIARRHEGLPAEFDSGLKRLEWLIDRYVRRATTLLDVTRISAANFNLMPDDVDYAALVRGVVEQSAPAARHVGTVVSVEAPASLPGLCDRLAFEQIAENLVTNAIKYGDEKPVLVRLAARRDTVELSVSDRGLGISAADQSRIFERFERVIAHARKGTGFGVGLWIVRQLVEAMGGRISLESTVGRGSTFHVELPIRAANKDRVTGETPH